MIERLAAWAHDLRYDQIPARVLTKARGQAVSVLAATHAAVNAGAAESVARAVAKWDKPGVCTVFPTGERTGLHEALWVNSARSMALDFDDYLYMGHTGHSAVLAAWAVGEEVGASGEAVLVAQVIANELAGRLGASAVLGPQNGQAWSFIHALGAAAAAARLYGLSVEETTHALGIALYQPSFTLWPGFFGPTSKELTAAQPTISGVVAAQLAAEGMTGAADVVEHPRHGFWARFAFAPLPIMMTGLGRAWVTDTLAYKIYPGCAYVDTTLDALFELLAAFRERHGRALAPEEVERVEIDASLMTVAMDNLTAAHGDPAHLSRVQINFSVPANVAIGIIAGRLTSAELRPEFLAERRSALQELAGRVTLRHDWSMTLEVLRRFTRAVGPGVLKRSLRKRDLLRILPGLAGHLGGPRRTRLDLAGALRNGGGELWRTLQELRSAAGPTSLDAVDLSGFAMTFPARVAIRLQDGRQLSTRCDVPLGGGGQSADQRLVDEKLRSEARPRLTAAQLEAAIAGLRSFEAHAPGALGAVCCGRV